MAYVVPLYTRGRVDAAGVVLAKESSERLFLDTDEALSIINNWRSSHRYPLNGMQVTIRSRAKKIDAEAIVPQRLKRMPAIEAKLRLHPGMMLSRMHDIGGCRAILRDVDAVRRVVDKCRTAASKSPNRGARLIKDYNYLDGSSPGPKADGYRGVHLVYQYRTRSDERKMYDGLRIEVQVRSRLQHAFATAVETASIFTEQPIKSIRANLQDERWRRFFALMGGALAIQEGTTIVPGLPADHGDLAEELRCLSVALDVEHVLTGWGNTVEELSGHTKDAKVFMILLDSETRTTKIIAYSHKDIPKSDEDYLAFEKSIKERPSQQVVLVDAESIDALRIGYPNFYLDTKAFIGAMKSVIG